MASVPPRTITAEREAWDRVANLVYKRRTALGLSAQQVVDRAGRGLSLTILSLIENSRQTSYSGRGVVALCQALDWKPDSIERILKGDKPVEVHPSEDAVKARLETLEETVARLKDEFAKIKEDLARERRQRLKQAQEAHNAELERALQEREQEAS